MFLKISTPLLSHFQNNKSHLMIFINLNESIKIQASQYPTGLPMNTIPTLEPLRTPAKVGAWMFVLWSVLHIWVGAEGLHQYLTGSPLSQWNMIIGGSAMPREAFVHASDAATAFAHGQLIVNFCVDVGVLVIGICDLAFLFSMVTSGVIELNAGTVGGPVIWFLALLITPWGLPRKGQAPSTS
jgi:hypothetical protein